MSYPNISGLELFEMPFRRQQDRRQAQASVQQPETAASAAQRQKPAAPAVQHEWEETPPVPEHRTDTVSRTGLQTKPHDSEGKAPSPHPRAAVPEEKIFSANAEEPARKSASKAPEQHQEAQAPPKTSGPADTSKQPEPKKELVLDMSAGAAASGSPLKASGWEKRRAHEAAEAERRAELDERQPARKQKEEAELQKLQNMSDDEVISASARRISTEVERITRRSMKECVSVHLQELCRRDPSFARNAMHPRKSMAGCFKYISRQAKEYVRQEMEDNDIKPDNGGYGCDVPDGLCYQWAEDYFNDPDAPEDQKKEDKFVPKPHAGAAPQQKKAASRTKKADKPAKKESKENQGPAGSGYEQMTLGV